MAEVPEGPPARFVWRKVAHRIVKAEGPERIENEWWRWLPMARKVLAEVDGITTLPLKMRVRDYYQLEEESGVCYWVFRAGLYQREVDDGPPRWFIHGLFG